MLTLKFPFIPVSANKTQKLASRGKKVVRYNSKEYLTFKEHIHFYLRRKVEYAVLEQLEALLKAPHMVFITIASPSVLKKDGTTHKTFGDSDNFVKPLLDSVYKYFGANDCYATIPVPNKTVSDETYTQVSWLPFKSWKENDFILVDHIREVVEGL